MKCSVCGKEIPDNSQICEYCGKKVLDKEPNTKQSNTLMIKIIAALVVILTASVFIPMLLRNQKMNKAVSLIESATNYEGYLEGTEIFASIKDKKYDAIYDFVNSFMQKSCEKDAGESAKELLRWLDIHKVLTKEDSQFFSDYIDYRKAEIYITDGQYLDAYYQYIRLGDYEDSADKAIELFENHKDVFYESAIDEINSMIPEEVTYAKKLFEMLDDYENSKALIHFIDCIENMRGTYRNVSRSSRTSNGYDEMFVVNYRSIETATNFFQKCTSVGLYYQYEGQPCLVVSFNNRNQSCWLFYSAGDRLYRSRANIVDGKITNIKEAGSFVKISDSTAPLTEPKIGMGASAVENSMWGKPTKINTTVTAGGELEQWVYSLERYVYLKNGVVTSIQTGTESEVTKNTNKIEFDFDFRSVTG